MRYHSRACIWFSFNTAVGRKYGVKACQWQANKQASSAKMAQN
jgi:hypothetical protein